MDFFARQEQSRRTSRALVAAFLLAFLIAALATTAAAVISLRAYTENNALFLGTEGFSDWLAGHRGLVAAIAAGTFGAMLLASLYRAATLARGGGQVARMLGATRVTGGGGNDPLARRLVNVVEEMALASGLPVPEIYVLEQEAAINAFAAGLTPADAAITVTRGALERLDRAELQGVVAHEFSHIANGDMRLNQQLIGLSFGILVLALVGRWLLRSVRHARGRRGRNSGVAVAVVIGLALTLIGGIGVLLSRLIKAGVSRQRERLADAAAVQFTREPEGLAGALKKIGGYGARIVSVDTEEVAHMLFERGTRTLGGWFATHPPLLDRIRALEPGFDPRDLPKAAPPFPENAAAYRSGAADTAAALAPPTAASPLERVGDIAPPAGGRALLAALPDEVHEATRSRDASLLVVLALALSADEPTRRKQLALIEQQLGAVRGARCERLFEELATAPRRVRLPVLELAMPALRQRPREQLDYLRTLLGRVQELERSARLFDFVLIRVLEAYLRAVPGLEPPATRASAPLEARAATRALLRTLAAYGHDDASDARGAYQAGLTSLGWIAEKHDDGALAVPADARSVVDLDAALGALTTIPPSAKKRVLAAVLATIRADEITADEELELFRLVAAALDCPIPPDVTF